MSYTYRVRQAFGSVGCNGQLVQYAPGDVVVFDAPRNSASFFERVGAHEASGDGEPLPATEQPEKPRRGRPPKARE